MKLYEIPLEWQAIQQELEQSLGELTPEMESRMETLIGKSKDKLTAAGLVKRNLEMHESLAQAQAGVFQEEAARVAGMAKSFGAAADKLGVLMAPALKTVGSIKTVAGTIYTAKRVNYAIALKPGVDIKKLPEAYWRQAEPELNKKPLQDLCKLHPLTTEQLEFVAGGAFKAKDLERIRAAMAVTDADLDVLDSDDLTPEQRASLEAIRGLSKCLPEVVAVRSETLTTCLRGAKPAELELAVVPAPEKSPEPAIAPDFDPFFDSPEAKA